jgi:hypothetical protein
LVSEAKYDFGELLLYSAVDDIDFGVLAAVIFGGGDTKW